MPTPGILTEDLAKIAIGDVIFSQVVAAYNVWKGRDSALEARIEQDINRAANIQCGNNGLQDNIIDETGKSVPQKEWLKKKILDDYKALSPSYSLPSLFPTFSWVFGPVVRLFSSTPDPVIQKKIAPSLFGTRQFSSQAYSQVSDRVLGKEQMLEEKRDRKGRLILKDGKPILKKSKYKKAEAPFKGPKYQYKNLTCFGGGPGGGRTVPFLADQEAARPVVAPSPAPTQRPTTGQVVEVPEVPEGEVDDLFKARSYDSSLVTYLHAAPIPNLGIAATGSNKITPTIVPVSTPSFSVATVKNLSFISALRVWAQNLSFMAWAFN